MKNGGETDESANAAPNHPSWGLDPPRHVGSEAKPRTAHTIPSAGAIVSVTNSVDKSTALQRGEKRRPQYPRDEIIHVWFGLHQTAVIGAVDSAPYAGAYPRLRPPRRPRSPQPGAEVAPTQQARVSVGRPNPQDRGGRWSVSFIPIPEGCTATFVGFPHRPPPARQWRGSKHDRCPPREAP